MKKEYCQIAHLFNVIKTYNIQNIQYTKHNYSIKFTYASLYPRDGSSSSPS